MANSSKHLASVARGLVANELGGQAGIANLSRLVSFWAETGDDKVDPALIEAFAGLLGQLDSTEIIREYRIAKIKDDIREGRKAKRLARRSRRRPAPQPMAPISPRIAPFDEGDHEQQDE
jgi:hypothetical protein